MGAINRSDKIAATFYSLGTWFVSGIYVYIPCIKETVMMMMMMIMIMIIIIIIKPKSTVVINGQKWKTVCFSGIAVQHLRRNKLVCDPRKNLSTEWKFRVECCSLGPRNTQ
jgi:hypothetical protein